MQTLEYLLAFHCAPALMGEKPANLVSCEPARYPGFEAHLGMLRHALLPHGIHLRPVCRCSGRVLLLVYRSPVLERHLRQPHVLSYLSAGGYPDGGLEAILSHLERRLSASPEFPHEIGILLGYPPEDVEGFCREHGKNCKFSGYWKVYGDEQRARALFARFRDCRRMLCTLLEQGTAFTQIFYVLPPIHQI